MTAVTVPIEAAARPAARRAVPSAIADPVAWLRNLTHGAPILAFGAAFFALLMVPTLVAMGLDDRTYRGISIWIKPLKFEISLFLFLGTLAVFARWLPVSVRQASWFRLYLGLVVLLSVLEIIWIGGAAAFGVGSHFNISQPIMGTIYGFMGFAAITLTSASLVMGVILWRDRRSPLDPALRLSLALGLVLTFVLTIITAGYMVSTLSHAVGGNELDIEAIPILGWATDGGDLRVSHFFATHAMYAPPLFGLAATAWLAPERRAAAIWVAALLFTGWVGYTFVEAVMGQPFLGLILGA